MKKTLITTLIIVFLSSCTLTNRGDVTSSTTPLVQRQYKSLLTNKTQGNKDFFNFSEYNID
ncbi:hypothetical protein [Francisella salimarina]|uniref:hypothetical protein n=1 Tax=Francisella salimarina TaxID=2599927 RepID=UPI003751F680